MMQCRNCAWFHRPRGRTPTTCRDVGEEPTNEACLQFEVHAPEPEPVEPSAAVGALTQETYRDIFHEVLAETFVLEQDARIAVDTIRAQLQTQGVNIDLEPGAFNRQAGRLVDLYMLYRLSLVIGLGRFADHIMKCEIERVFRDREEPKKKTKVVAT